ncbi:MAG TPA: hypothetical protein VMR18_03870 [Candidatus Saccharimonadales bacterium]|nr:hypothetical protein [Candidatus Saccharimonadales bacterium]
MSIRSTRVGYFYQDIYAVHLFIKHYLEHDILAIFVDYEYDSSGHKSFDIRIIKNDRDEDNYEVKTGDAFKDQNTLIAEAFVDLIQAKKDGYISETGQAILLISPEFRAQIANYYAKLLYLKSHTLGAPESPEAIALFAARMPAVLCTDNTELHNRLKQIGVVCGEDNKIAHGERFSPIEQIVIAQIRSLAENLGIDSPNASVFPEETLLRELVYTVHANAGSNVSLYDEFRRLIISFFARYSLPTTEITAGIGGTLDESRKDVEDRLASFEGQTVTKPTAVDINPPEGSTIGGEDE